jgi:hypothetical protein
MLARTDAPYSAIKEYWDPRELYAFVSPENVEKMFVEPERGGQEEDISQHYLHSFILSLLAINRHFQIALPRIPSAKIKWTKTKLKEYGFEEIRFWSEVTEIRVSFEPEKSRISLNWVMIRPCAEGNGLYAIILFWMAKICSQFDNIDLVVSDCLEVNQNIMRKYNFHEERIPSKFFRRKEINYILTNVECKQLMPLHMNIQDKIISYDATSNLLELNNGIFPSATELNDWEFVQNKFLNNANALEDYIRHRFAVRHRVKVNTEKFNQLYEIHKEHFREEEMQKIARKINQARPAKKDQQEHEDDEISEILQATGKTLKTRKYLVSWNLSDKQTWESRSFFEENVHRKTLRDRYDEQIRNNIVPLVPRHYKVAPINETHSEKFYEVEEIVAAYGIQIRGKKSDRSTRRYLTKWVGYDEMTWEFADTFDVSPALIKLRRKYDNLLFQGKRRLIRNREVNLLRDNGIQCREGVDYKALSIISDHKDDAGDMSLNEIHLPESKPSMSPGVAIRRSRSPSLASSPRDEFLVKGVDTMGRRRRRIMMDSPIEIQDSAEGMQSSEAEHVGPKHEGPSHVPKPIVDTRVRARPRPLPPPSYGKGKGSLDMIRSGMRGKEGHFLDDTDSDSDSSNTSGLWESDSSMP